MITYPEPAIGTREEWVKSFLWESYRDPDRGRINSSATSVTGLQLDDKFVVKLDV